MVVATARANAAACACSTQLCQLNAEQSALYLTCTMVAQGVQIPPKLTSNLLGTLNLLATERTSEFQTTCAGKTVPKLPALNGDTDLQVGTLQVQAQHDFAIEHFPFVKLGTAKTEAIELFENKNDASCAKLAANFVVPTQPTIDLSTKSLDCGTVAVFNYSSPSFQMENLGTDLLTGTINGPAGNCNTSPFCVYAAGPFSLKFGGIEKVQVQFSPTSTGTFSATVTIKSNDPAHPSETVSLSGTGD
ncbi:MAG: choice-of-anchor D domain-containing protein [Candidatus Binataceae bacterium]